MISDAVDSSPYEASNFIMGDSFFFLRLFLLMPSIISICFFLQNQSTLGQRCFIKVVYNIGWRESLCNTSSTCRGRLVSSRGNRYFPIRLWFGGRVLRKISIKLCRDPLECTIFHPFPVVHTIYQSTMLKVWGISLITLSLVYILRVWSCSKILGALKYF